MYCLYWNSESRYTHHALSRIRDLRLRDISRKPALGASDMWILQSQLLHWKRSTDTCVKNIVLLTIEKDNDLSWQWCTWEWMIVGWPWWWLAVLGRCYPKLHKRGGKEERIRGGIHYGHKLTVDQGSLKMDVKYHQYQLLTSISLEQQMFHILLTLLKWK